MPWLSRTTYRTLFKEIASWRRRIRELEEALALERHENRLAERHWSNQLLRAKNSFPQQPEKTISPQPLQLEPVIDSGEREALIDAAKAAGIADPEREADRVLREERGLAF